MIDSETEAREQFMERVRKLKNKVESLPLSTFTVRDLRALSGVLDPYREPREKDVSQLEKRVIETKKGRVRILRRDQDGSAIGMRCEECRCSWKMYREPYHSEGCSSYKKGETK